MGREARCGEGDGGAATCAEAPDGSGQDGRAADLAARLRESEGRCEELMERLQRMAAEFENHRKRGEKERETLYAFATANAVREFLPVLDNLGLAASADMPGDLRVYKEGVEMVYRGFSDTLAKMGVERIATDKGFDPESHEAVMHVSDEAYGESVVVEVFKEGYRLGDKVLRHSLVKVAN